MNHVIHIAAACQIRLNTDGRAYYRRKLAAGKSRVEARRCLIGELSVMRPGDVPGRGSSVVSGDGLVAVPL